MIEHRLDKENGILYIRPVGPLRKEDFEAVAREVDPFLDMNDDLKGVIIETRNFPGWENFRAMIQHFKFIRGHHRKIRKVAMVTDSPIGEIAEHITSHFVSAEIKHFKYGDAPFAKEWILEKNSNNNSFPKS